MFAHTLLIATIRGIVGGCKVLLSGCYGSYLTCLYVVAWVVLGGCLPLISMIMLGPRYRCSPSVLVYGIFPHPPHILLLKKSVYKEVIKTIAS